MSIMHIIHTYFHIFFYFFIIIFLPKIQCFMRKMDTRKSHIAVCTFIHNPIKYIYVDNLLEVKEWPIQEYTMNITY